MLPSICPLAFFVITRSGQAQDHTYQHEEHLETLPAAGGMILLRAGLDTVYV